MKRTKPDQRPARLRLFALTLLLLALAALLAACGKGIPADEAKERAESFIAAVGEERYKDAAALMHPSRETAGDDVKMYFSSMTTEYGVDFTKNFRVLRWSGFRSSVYNSDYEGSYYELTGTAAADEAEFEIRVEIVRNEYGYGIHNVHFDFDFDED